MNNFVPMNMIPFIANMKNSSKGGEKPTPQPSIDPIDLIHKIMLNSVELHYYDGEDCWTSDSQDIFASISKDALTYYQGYYPDALFKLCDNNSIRECVIVQYESMGENSADVWLMFLDNLDAEPKYASLSFETDAETGDSRTILAFGPEPENE